MTRIPLSYWKQGSVTNWMPDVALLTNETEQTKVPSTPAVRLTRRQLAKLEEEEALSKSQRAPSPPAAEEHEVEHVAEEAAEQTEAASEAKADVKTEGHVAPTPHEETVEVEPQTARKPTRRTRRQQTKREEQTEETIAQDAAQAVTKGPVAPVEAAHAVAEVETPIAIGQIETAEPEPAAKPVRLTRRQQAKLEEEQKQAQAEQRTPQPAPTEEEALDEIVAEAKADVDAAATEEEVVPGGATHEGIDAKEDIAPATTTESSSTHAGPAMNESRDDKPVQVQEEAVEQEPPIGPQPIESQVQEAVAVEDVPPDAVEERPATPTEAEFEADFNMHVDDAVASEVAPLVEITSEAEPKMLHAEKPFEATVTTPIKSQGSIRRASRSPSRSPMRLEESISAIDRLEEDLESIGKAIPDLDDSEDERLPKKSESSQTSASSTVRGKTSGKTPAKTPAKVSARTPAKAETKTSGQTPSKAPVPTRAPVAARASIAPKPPVPTKATLPARISRVPSAAPKSVKPTTTSLARASSVRTAPSKDVTKPSTETADYLASKRRPISLSFPTPPPPPKGRAPTKPSFQLSSDNVAAKLKAQKEERLKREAEGAAAPKQRPISMPPPPKSTKPPTVPSFQLSSEATAAKLKAQKEERLKRMETAGGADKPSSRPISMPPPPKSTKQLTRPSFQLPGEAAAARLKAQKEARLKRMEEAEAAKKAAAAAPVRKPIAHRPRESLLVRDAPGVSIPPPPQTDTLQRSTSIASKRSSIGGATASRSVSTSSANRNSALLAEGGKSTVTPVDAAALKVKGKQVFNRDKMEKEAMERERREKEEAAKRARAEAAERGRIASREWAERQRKKLMGQ